ncbi:MAG: hypothetical protein NTW29_06220 [Bacteroidetes bacterium]|nr:hypothetical protein [Bacteroidota bacterium]
MKKIITLLVICLIGKMTQAQNNLGIGTATPAASAKLDVSATDKGILIPRMTLAQRNAIASPAISLLIYQTDNTPGYYYYNGSTWTTLGGSVSSTQLPNAMFGHNTTNTQNVVYITPFSAASSPSLNHTNTFLIPAGTTITLTFYSYENEAITYELFNVTPTAGSATFTVVPGALASTSTATYTSGAPVPGTFTYTATTGQLLTIGMRPTAGGGFTGGGIVYSMFSAN